MLNLFASEGHLKKDKKMTPPEKEITQEFADVCRSLGWKFTASRFAVYRYLKGNTEHPVVDRVWEMVRLELPAIARESVYRILNDFAARGLIALMDRPDVVARYDANPKRHDHYYCSRCGRVFDFEMANLEALLPDEAKKIGRIDKVETRIRGVCRECLAELEKESNEKTI